MQGSTQHFQFQIQPPSHQDPGLFATTQPASVPTSASATLPMDNCTVQTPQSQSGQVPQAPIGSPMPLSMPPMSLVDQYMQSYPANPMGLATSHRQLAGDTGKMLSGSRHKNEVKRRTKTGCLTCRKRRIKVCIAEVQWLVVLLFTCRSQGRIRGGIRGGRGK